MIHLPLIVLRLSEFYKNELLELSYHEYFRLCWLDNCRGMLFLHIGLKELIKQYYLTDGWIVLFRENLYRDFIAHYPMARDMLLFTRVQSQGFIPIDKDMLDRFGQYAVQLKYFIDGNSPLMMVQPVLDSMLMQAGLNFAKHENLKLNSWSDQQYAQIDRMIQEHFREERDDEFYARELGMNVQQLNAICRRVKGRYILPLVNMARLAAGQSELTNTAMSVKQIAMGLGFKTDSHFSNFFKRATSMTPMAYRKRNSRM